jgi:hypothetical protein
MYISPLTNAALLPELAVFGDCEAAVAGLKVD